MEARVLAISAKILDDSRKPTTSPEDRYAHTPPKNEAPRGRAMGRRAAGDLGAAQPGRAGLQYLQDPHPPPQATETLAPLRQPYSRQIDPLPARAGNPDPSGRLEMRGPL